MKEKLEALKQLLIENEATGNLGFSVFKVIMEQVKVLENNFLLGID